MPIPRGDKLIGLINRPPYREYRVRDLMPEGAENLDNWLLAFDQLKAELDRLAKAGYVRRKEIGGVPFYYSVRT
jgi:hypothetical protein